VRALDHGDPPFLFAIVYYFLISIVPIDCTILVYVGDLRVSYLFRLVFLPKSASGGFENCLTTDLDRFPSN
jgi:hypothetical protein